MEVEEIEHLGIACRRCYIAGTGIVNSGYRCSPDGLSLGLRRAKKMAAGDASDHSWRRLGMDDLCVGRSTVGWCRRTVMGGVWMGSFSGPPTAPALNSKHLPSGDQIASFSRKAKPSPDYERSQPLSRYATNLPSAVKSVSQSSVWAYGRPSAVQEI